LYEHALYIKKNKDNMMFVALYVHDLIFMRNKVEMIQEFNVIVT